MSGKITTDNPNISGQLLDWNEITLTWGNTSYTWSDVSLVLEAVGASSRRRRIDPLYPKPQIFDNEPEKRERLIRLIFRVKGENVFDESILKEDYEIQVEDIELLAREVLKKRKVSVSCEVGGKLYEQTKYVNVGI